MKKLFTVLLLILMVFGCTSCQAPRTVPESFSSAEEVLSFMKAGNDQYVSSVTSSGNISSDLRQATAKDGQSPYAVVVTCSDSRVPPEHIFSAGIGEIFVIRTAGNVIGEFDIGSVEYGADHLHTKLVLVLGHTGCGAVEATLSGGGHGDVGKITDEIASALPAECTAREAEILNVKNSIERILENQTISELVERGEVAVRGAIYDISTGKVEFLSSK